ncbi:MAG: CBS domain-containing protein [Sphingobacteriales bacterium 17-39-43]|uniref:CBS domain-containing protein n=1 Tax=Daejeonella sp. TaxID=2805397 RepID=UPI000BCCEAE4|nr:CBS domain-containing protein [Daejeonella sp.]OYZ33364.1 MAG: CBS domain-containing protein [Sphingobacteriales bacterium 16-39-50]OYZ57304.1 MAG: CBS domain-containing protein [Sphingobacteriales bacterium 24-40-4]OZA24407.1 MAG: CBS domain-containing protein [Sphingobacteriales bacterium 17-39-43]HQT22379.1 CBS domain-containing protein [Daejeonella sp.]HQT56780.1 CBS domain-containing protein [Daejeonella sp.]
MFAHELISDSIPALRTSDTVQKVHERMAEFRVNHLPIVNDKQFLGLVSDEDLVEVQDSNAPVGSLSLALHNPFVYEEQHIYDVIRLFYEQKLSLVPVLDSNKNYKGLISINTMMEYVATITSVKEPGGIIILEITNRNNSLAHISQIVESDNAQILSSYVQSFPDSTKLEITLKLNRTDLSSIIASFLRYDYHVKATFNDTKSDDRTSDRYDQLMNYLDI